ncbi:MAG: hypothetical protein ACFFDH_03365 [Promethearchaeota archaeon]
MYWGKITLELFNEFLAAINNFIENNEHYVDVKKIRKFYKIKSSNRSKINFYFRFLKLLEQNGLIRIIIGKNKPKKYELPESKIELNQIIVI